MTGISNLDAVFLPKTTCGGMRLLNFLLRISSSILRTLNFRGERKNGNNTHYEMRKLLSKINVVYSTCAVVHGNICIFQKH